MSTDGYLTDASLDALSQYGDGPDDPDPGSNNIKMDFDQVFSPKTPVNTGSTPTPLFSLLDIRTPVPPMTPTSEPKTAYFVDKRLADDYSLLSALKEMGIEPSTDTITESSVPNLDYSSSIIIFSEFSGPLFDLFDSLRRKSSSQRPRIFGPSAIISASQRAEKKLPVSKLGYPMYSQHLENCRIAATGFSSKEQLQEVRRKILYLGGSFMEHMSERGSATDHGVITHLIAEKCRGIKYQDAVYLGKPIVSPEWVDNLWRHRDNIYYDWNSSLKQYRLKCFHACKIALHGFAPQEKAEMTKLVLENGGTVVDPDDPTASHILCLDTFCMTYDLRRTLAVEGDSIDETDKIIRERDSAVIIEDQVEEWNQPRKTRSSLRTRTPTSSSSAALKNSEDDFYEIEAASPLKRGRFELDVINDVNEAEAEAAKTKEFASRAKVLKVEWFWNSVQIEACSDEKLYLVEGRSNNTNHSASFDLDHTIQSCGTPASFLSPNFPMSDQDGATPKSGTSGSAGRRKRKRLREYVSSLAQVDYPRFVSEVTPSAGGVPNLGGNSLDQSQEKEVVSDSDFAYVLKELSLFFKNADLKSKTRRYIEFYQLLETERNYVTVLMNIVKIFKEPCENEEQTGGRILSTREINTIFSTILPIYTLHRRLLRDLFQLQNPWNEENLIGKVYYDYAKELRKVYEPFVNFFESVKNEIVRCEAEKPRFLALLRIAQCKPECGKQSLSELIIRPVQRLPSTALILSNLEKHTAKSNPDAEWISKGLKALNLCIQSLNEEKARNEGRVAIFEAFAEIEGCPAKTISDHRTILMKFDVSSLTDLYGQKFDPITLFIFTDHIQVTKRRGCPGSSKGISAGMSVANLRSPSVSRKSIVPGSASMNHHPLGHQQKKYKYYEWIDFPEIRRVLDVYDTQTPSFAFVVRGPRDLRERILVFTCPDDIEWPKEKLLIFLAKQLANAVNRVDFENLIAKADSASLNVNENAASVLEKAARFATKTRHKVGRALSLNRTPSKLKRTMSQMMSPFTASRRRLDPDSISQMGDDSPPPPPRPSSYIATPRLPTFSEVHKKYK